MNLSPLPSISQNALKWPSGAKAPTDLVDSNPKMFGPLSHSQCAAAESKANVAPAIIRLIFLRAPFAVLLFVWSIVVETVDGLSRRTLTHIFKEMGERMPSLAHGHATPPVVIVPGIIRVLAALDHVRPDAVGARIRKAVLERAPLSSLASARARVPISQGTRDNGKSIPAGAATLPACRRYPIFRQSPERREFAEYFACFYSLRHGEAL